MDKRSRRRFTKEFKSETVALIRHSGKSIAEVCRDMGLAESSVHRWLAQAEIDSGQCDGLTTTEREELSRSLGTRGVLHSMLLFGDATA